MDRNHSKFSSDNTIKPEISKNKKIYTFQKEKLQNETRIKAITMEIRKSFEL